MPDRSVCTEADPIFEREFYNKKWQTHYSDAREETILLRACSKLSGSRVALERPKDTVDMVVVFWPNKRQGKVSTGCWRL